MNHKIINKICSNPWCRAQYKVKLEIEEEVIDISEIDENNLNDSIDDLLNDIKSNRKKEKEEPKKQDIPKTCPKCRSFDNELSGGVSWKEKKYSGPRQDGKAHGVGFRFSQYRPGKGFWNR